MENNDLLNDDEIKFTPRENTKLDWTTWVLIGLLVSTLLFFLIWGVDTAITQINGCDYCKEPITYYNGTLTSDDTIFKEFKHWESDDNIDGVSLYYITTQGWFIESGSDAFVHTERITVLHCPICGREG